jgi:hypothetical protein
MTTTATATPPRVSVGLNPFVMPSDDASVEANTGIVFFKRGPGAALWRPIGFGGGGSGHKHAHEPSETFRFVNKRYNVKRAIDGDQRPLYSHYSYLGGATATLTVPQGTATVEFASAVISDFCMGRFSCFAEVCTSPSFRFYVDVDLALPYFPEESFWQQLEKIISEAVSVYFPEIPPESDTFHFIVLSAGVQEIVPKTTSGISAADGSDSVSNAARETTDPHAGPKSAASMFKVGVHVVYPNLFVDVDTALHLSSGIIAAAEYAFPEVNEDTWRHRIDQAVYGKTRGLRWVWQFKAAPCENCCRPPPPGKSAPVIYARGCDVCDHRGIVADPSSSMYAPVYMVTKGCCRTPWPASVRRRPTVDLMLLCSIRAPVEGTPPTPGFVVPTGAPMPPTLALKTKATNMVAVLFEDAGEVRRALSGGGVEVDRASPQFAALEAMVRNLHKEYANIHIRTAIRGASGSWYRVMPKNAGSKFCMNVNREHGSSTVSFYVTSQGIRQQCYSKKVAYTCAKYMSPLRPMKDSDRALLFPSLGTGGGGSSGGGAGGSAGFGYSSGAGTSSAFSGFGGSGHGLGDFGGAGSGGGVDAEVKDQLMQRAASMVQPQNLTIAQTQSDITAAMKKRREATHHPASAFDRRPYTPPVLRFEE